jgi:hypothetical protein
MTNAAANQTMLGRFMGKSPGRGATNRDRTRLHYRAAASGLQHNSHKEIE